MFQILAVISIVLFFAAAPPYIRDTVKGKTKPQRATWFIWSVLGVIAFASQWELGAQWSLLFAGLDALSSIITFCLSIRFGVGGWTLLDRVALVVAAGGVAIALIANQPVVAILGISLADVSGTMLTIRKTFRAPNSETGISWLLVGTGALCGVLSVGKFDIALLIYPAYLMLANYVVPATQLYGRMYWRRYPHQQPAIV